jgi:hypothetical protein
MVFDSTLVEVRIYRSQQQKENNLTARNINSSEISAPWETKTLRVGKCFIWIAAT